MLIIRLQDPSLIKERSSHPPDHNPPITLLRSLCKVNPFSLDPLLHGLPIRSRRRSLTVEGQCSVGVCCLSI